MIIRSAIYIVNKENKKYMQKMNYMVKTPKALRKNQA